MQLRPAPPPSTPRIGLGCPLYAVVLLLLIHCLLLRSHYLWVFRVGFLFCCLVYLCVFLVFQPSWRGRECWLFYLALSSWCLVTVSFLWFFHSRYRGLICKVWLWYFLIILTRQFKHISLPNLILQCGWVTSSHNICYDPSLHSIDFELKKRSSSPTPLGNFADISHLK